MTNQIITTLKHHCLGYQALGPPLHESKKKGDGLRGSFHPYGCWTKNRGTPKWVIYNGKPYEQIDDLGFFPYFWKHPYKHHKIWWKPNPHHHFKTKTLQTLKSLKGKKCQHFYSFKLLGWKGCFTKMMWELVLVDSLGKQQKHSKLVVKSRGRHKPKTKSFSSMDLKRWSSWWFQPMWKILIKLYRLKVKQIPLGVVVETKMPTTGVIIWHQP